MVHPTPAQMHLFTVLSVSGLGVVSIFGIAMLVARWRDAHREEAATSTEVIWTREQSTERRDLEASR
jgi:hypothetical protein